MSEVRVLWLRRFRADQALEMGAFTGDARDLINNDCRAGLIGLFATSFSGKWVSSPEATVRGSDKVYQLAAARSCGFRIPDTLVTQHKDQVVAFRAAHPAGVIAKPLAGVSESFLLTRFLDDPASLEDQAFRIAPAIYQEYIPGSRHIRLNCFGQRSYAGMIESVELDWRPNLNVPIVAWPVPASLHAMVRSVLDLLCLEMGIVDLKLTPDGDFVWLEVNPQGQFLFLDAVTRLDLASRFAEYLIGLSEK